MEDRRIVLIGYRGTGKSSIGKNIASILGLEHIDIDTQIEKQTGKTIPRIFEEAGEEGFRDIESAVINHLADTPAVVSAGGGAVLRSQNIKVLRRKSQIILLTSNEEDIIRRIAGTSRPSLTSLSLADEIHITLEQRMPMYRASADISYDSSGKRPLEAAGEIVQMIRPGMKQTREMRARKTLVNWILSTPVSKAAQKPLLTSIDDPDIRLYGILGYPCMHSKSPSIWNRLFQELEMPACYTWFECSDPERFIPMAEDAGVRGISVTIPHKEKVMPLLNEIDQDAQVIGKVNTILLLDGKRYGFNTDWNGIYQPLEGVTGDTAIILGAGGAAASAVYAAKKRGFSPVILNRTVERAKVLASRFGAEFGPLSAFNEYHADLVINATSVGMGEEVKDSNLEASLPVPSSLLLPDMHIFDLVYTPVETPFLKAAQKRGCHIIPGTEMFIHQLVEQFRILTGVDVQADTIREWLI